MTTAGAYVPVPAWHFFVLCTESTGSFEGLRGSPLSMSVCVCVEPFCSCHSVPQCLEFSRKRPIVFETLRLLRCSPKRPLKVAGARVPCAGGLRLIEI